MSSRRWTRAPRGRLALPRRLPAGAAGVALTFDDGPHPEGTPAVLEVLARAGARATFFVVGEQVRAPAGAGRADRRRRATVALHGYRHRLQLRLSTAQVRDDIARGAAAIEDAAGRRPAWHRPPYGIYSPAGPARGARDAGCGRCCGRAGERTGASSPRPAGSPHGRSHGVLPGDVILLHDADFYSARNSHRRTAAALRLILAELKRRKLGTVLPV